MKRSVVLPDGNSFTGEFDDAGIRNGIGTKTYKNGATYQGTWINDKRHGLGIKTHANSSQRVVEYNNGILLRK